MKDNYLIGIKDTELLEMDKYHKFVTKKNICLQTKNLEFLGTHLLQYY